MAKRQRIEDLGIIYEKISRFLDEDNILEKCRSKHDIEAFMEKYKSEDNLYDLFYYLRNIEEFLCDIWTITRGEDTE